MDIEYSNTLLKRSWNLRRFVDSKPLREAKNYPKLMKNIFWDAPNIALSSALWINCIRQVELFISKYMAPLCLSDEISFLYQVFDHFRFSWQYEPIGGIWCFWMPILLGSVLIVLLYLSLKHISYESTSRHFS